MRWPQCELRRVFAAVAVFSAALGCFVAGYKREWELMPVMLPIVIILLGASIGIPFRKGVTIAIGLPLILLLILFVFVLIALLIHGPIPHG
jgi:hypothetical protein